VHFKCPFNGSYGGARGTRDVLGCFRCGVGRANGGVVVLVLVCVCVCVCVRVTDGDVCVMTSTDAVAARRARARALG